MAKGRNEIINYQFRPYSLANQTVSAILSDLDALFKVIQGQEEQLENKQDHA